MSIPLPPAKESAKRSAWIVAARRTPVAPINGAFRDIEPFDLGACVIRALINDAAIKPHEIDAVFLGNALYGGGNPARMAALAADLPHDVAAMSIDTQCCGGLDAIALAASQIESGACEAVIAGGIESYSRAPMRYRRPKAHFEAPVLYERPPFTPWPDNDPDMIEAAAKLAQMQHIFRDAQEEYAMASHACALREPPSSGEIVAIDGLSCDAFTRRLAPQLCARMPVLAGDDAHGVTAATIAVEADAAAAVLVVSDEIARRHEARRRVQILDRVSMGGDPAMPGLAPVKAAQKLLARCGLTADDIAIAEIMEAFAAQAIACRDLTGLQPARVNRGGGALARGHPIGASGAILIVRLWHELQKVDAGQHGLAIIAAAGGLGSAMALTRD